MNIKSMIFHLMGPANPIYLRPWTVTASPENIRQLHEMFKDGFPINAISMASFVRGLIDPANCLTLDGPVSIPNGWGGERFRFEMEVEVNSTARVKTRLMLYGYTDAQGMVNSGHSVTIDPEMQLYFNSKFHITDHLMVSIDGNDWETMCSNSEQIITSMEDSSVLLRPVDVVSNASLNSDRFTNMRFVDIRPRFVNNKVRSSKRSNSQASAYIGNLLAALQDSEKDMFHDTSSMMNDARSMLKELPLQSNSVFEELQLNTELFSRGFVTWGELCKMNPTLDGISEFYVLNPPPEKPESSPWDGNTTETVSALMIANSITGYMIQSLASEIDVVLKNGTNDGTVECNVLHFVPIRKNISIDKKQAALIARLKNELFPELLPYSTSHVEVRIKAGLGADTAIWIKMDGGVEEVFVYPSFADGLASPVLTNNDDTLSNLVDDIMNVHRWLTEY